VRKIRAARLADARSTRRAHERSSAIRDPSHGRGLVNSQFELEARVAIVPNEEGRISEAPATLDFLSIDTPRCEALLVPREGIIRNHRHDEPLFVLSMVA
jgi:hypothetical protein